MMTAGNPRRKFGSGTIAGCVAIILSLGFSGLVIHDHFRISLSSYEVVSGTVTTSKVRHSISAGGTSGASSVQYSPDIAYTYVVNGVTYDGHSKTSLNVSSGAGDRTVAQSIVALYPQGSPIEIWYKTDAYDVSVVAIEDKMTFFKLMSGIVFGLFGGACIWLDRWIIRTRAEEKATHTQSETDVVR